MVFSRLFHRLTSMAAGVAAAACCHAVHVDTAIAQVQDRHSFTLTSGGEILYTKWVAPDSLLACSYNNSAQRLSFTLLGRSSSGTWSELRRWHRPSATTPLSAAAVANTTGYTTAALMYHAGPMKYLVRTVSLPQGDSTATISADTTVQFALPSGVTVDSAHTHRVHAWSTPENDLTIAIQAVSVLRNTASGQVQEPRHDYSVMRYRVSQQNFLFDFAHPASLLQQSRHLGFIGITDNGYLLQGTGEGIRAFVGDTARLLTSAAPSDALHMQWDNTLFAAHSPSGLLRPDGSWTGFSTSGASPIQSLRVGNTIAVLRRDLDTPVVFFNAFSGVRTGAINGTSTMPRSMDVSPNHSRLAIAGAGARLDVIGLPTPAIQSAVIVVPPVIGTNQQTNVIINDRPIALADDIRWEIDGDLLGTGPSNTLSLPSEGLYVLRAFVGDSGNYRASPGALIYAVAPAGLSVDVAEDITVAGMAHSVAVYPNPAASTVRIDVAPSFRRLHVVALDGRRVYSADLQGRTSLSWDLASEAGSRLSPGLYTVVAITAEGTAVAVPLVVAP